MHKIVAPSRVDVALRESGGHRAQAEFASCAVTHAVDCCSPMGGMRCLQNIFKMGGNKEAFIIILMQLIYNAAYNMKILMHNLIQ